MMKIYKGKRVLLPGGSLGPAAVYVEDGKIVDVFTQGAYLGKEKEGIHEVIDAGDLVLMPGVVDSHVHVNEPGREEWEGFITATRAAAVGGITTIVDMPLNSIPSTVSVSAFKTKMKAAEGKCFVDVGFWGGVIPGNQNELRSMLAEGVVGFKCFMINSGVKEFPHVSEDDLHQAMAQLQGTGAVLLFHAELDCQCQKQHVHGKAEEYDTFLGSRPDQMETEAIKMICRLAKQYNVPSHIVHLSTAEALPIIHQARQDGAPVTVETTHHYLFLEAGGVPNGATQYKCVPPIRTKENQNCLWQAVKDGSIDLVISDHSPCTADLKLLQEGDFMKAWGGIAGLQFGLSLLWTNAEKHGLGLPDVQRLLCEGPAKLSGLHKRKGRIQKGYDADFVIWEPRATFQVEEAQIEHKNKVTPYLGCHLKGVVHQTVVRGQTVYTKGKVCDQPQGTFMLRDKAV